MQKTIICVHCGREVAANPCLKGNQSYCNLSACQSARKKKWYQNKIDSDPVYAVRQKDSKRNWRKNKPGHAYQKQYRDTHPDYVLTNREQQRQRNRKRRLLEKQSESQKIVKIDTLLVELQEYQEVGCLNR